MEPSLLGRRLAGAMRLRICPVSGGVEMPGEGCAQECVWPPAAASLADARLDGADAVAEPPGEFPDVGPVPRSAAAGGHSKEPRLARSTAELTGAAVVLRRLLGDIEQELGSRHSTDAAGAGGPELAKLLAELEPVRWPRDAAGAEEVETLAAEICRVPRGAARGYLARAGFLRVRRMNRGRDAYRYVYKLRFPGGRGTQPRFVRLTAPVR